MKVKWKIVDPHFMKNTLMGAWNRSMGRALMADKILKNKMAGKLQDVT